MFPMLRLILLYGAILAAGTFVLEWLEYRLLERLKDRFRVDVQEP